MATHLTLQDFIGFWDIDRDIDDRLTGLQSTFSGTATIHKDGNYAENGDLTLPTGAVLKASRTYLWFDMPGGIQINFPDGRPFHQIRLTHPTDRHLCDPDTYDVRYDLGKFPDWTAFWHVTGPKKDYEMVSRYRKRPGHPLAIGA